MQGLFGISSPTPACVEVAGSHIGLMANRTAYRAIASTLGRAELPLAVTH